VCDTYRREELHAGFSWEKEGKEIILKPYANMGFYCLRESSKSRMGVWTQLMWLRRGTSGSPLRKW